MALVKVKIPGHKPVYVDESILETHRPKERPKDVTPEHWEKSECEPSPTGAHYFRPRIKRKRGKSVVGRSACVFCKRLHTSIYPSPHEPEEPKEEAKEDGS